MPRTGSYGTITSSGEQVCKQDIDNVMDELVYTNHRLQSQIDGLRAEIAWIREKSIFIDD